ncbi:hypothetical protein EWI61_05845 [Methylolobus aquaticus]|nr:hypothetical protein EWI61_05845 [Methylolobus aquaticus]
MVWILLLSCSLVYASVPLPPRIGPDGKKADMFGCMQSNDYYVVNFAAYQVDPQSPPNDRRPPVAYCLEIPRAGSTRVTLDLLDRDVRRKSVALTILDGAGKRVLSMPMGEARSGVVSADVDFPGPGFYDLVLYVDDTDLRIPPDVGALHMPLRVALPTPLPKASLGQWATVVLVIGALVFGLGLLLPRALKSRPPNAKEVLEN